VLCGFFFKSPAEFLEGFCKQEWKMSLSNLTGRELQILKLVVAGYTNKAIAAEILISEKTVEFHLENIYRKLGVQTRLMAGVWALKKGLTIDAREIGS
jgi:DNA-binding NarL/FixJ family response regulator